jgi:hypothetical protein
VTPRVDWVVVGGPAEPWVRLGLVAAAEDEDGCQLVPIFGTGVEIDTTSPPGLRRLVLSGIDDQITDIDGVPVEVRDAAPPMFADHPLGVSHIDHVVIATDDLARTCGAIADITSSPLKRVREAGEVRQGFHRVGGPGGLIVEVVERAGLPPDSASLWGFVFVVDDIHEACRTLGPDVIGEPRDAVQPGRFIATVRSGVGLGVPLALMSPDVR